LYAIRNRLLWVAGILISLLYIRYVDSAYLGRGPVVQTLAILLLSVWFLRPAYRSRLVIISTVAAPFVLYGFYLYALIRIGDVVRDVGLLGALSVMLQTELGFVRDVGVKILETGARVDLGRYLLWIVTLPLPKILTGPIEVARINYEISEVVLGMQRGTYGWYVVLPGLVAESIYIFGTRLFWLHGVFLGLIAAFFAKVAERVPQLFFLYLYLVVMFGFVLNRGGIASLLPPVINEFLLFYLFLVAIIVHRQGSRRAGGSHPNQGRTVPVEQPGGRRVGDRQVSSP
jgi:hypothetical protein